MDKKKRESKNDRKKRIAVQTQTRVTQEKENRAPLVQVRHNRECVSNRVYDLYLDNITVMQGGIILLDNSELQLTQGRKYGLVGRNGVGKTSLLYALASGEFKIPEHLQILLVEQEMAGNHKTPLQQVLETDVEREALLKEQEQLASNEENSEKQDGRISDIYRRLEEIDAHTAESRASSILGGLGFTQDMINNPTQKLSGGWRMRVSLARALFVQPDILLLDEPTNHLDLDAVIWLEEFIQNSDVTIVLVSHSRAFLNRVCTDIIHLCDSKLTYYSGNYDQFVKTRTELQTLQRKKFEFNQAERQDAKAFIDKFRANAKLASLVQSRIKALDKMEEVEDIIEDHKTVFQIPQPEKLSSYLLRIEDGKFGYSENNIIFEELSFAVHSDSKIAIIGDNGAGKSTFLKLLTGNLELMYGHQMRNPKLIYSYFTQHHIDQLDMDLTPVESLQKQFKGQTPEHFRAYLSKFGLKGSTHLRQISELSGGQKSRVALAKQLYTCPHLLILDEPTNHLDLDAIDALIDTLKSYNGGFIVVSHDEHLVESICQQIFYVKDKKMVQFKGDFQAYRKALITRQL
ncbi:hypothetical protein IMG5_079000 [Ichthyophthirius multifiliis]|uniref:ABC transporter domain-containing protein n=1 Tax=Ichthyophthirius multifiliis TaxID=5932 RepID=G0QQH2_ICHMU|nr:hypothetical protein IMG5_079000 [Ichthyophthirius multifiliis]EGR32530.1 hypothetical protein IMG5_079000 [Ichthyophthirius multifiliis]|eukprot:XP_004036516.1 hypothetical protein IMG5_079000 [Ichthyophthirius multifiliis]